MRSLGVVEAIPGASLGNVKVRPEKKEGPQKDVKSRKRPPPPPPPKKKKPLVEEPTSGKGQLVLPASKPLSVTKSLDFNGFSEKANKKAHCVTQRKENDVVKKIKPVDSSDSPDDRLSNSGDAVNYVTRTLMKSLGKPHPTVAQKSPSYVFPSHVKNSKKHLKDEPINETEEQAFSPIKSQITKLIFKAKPKVEKRTSQNVTLESPASQQNKNDAVNYVTRTLLKSLDEPRQIKISETEKKIPEVAKISKKAKNNGGDGNYVKGTLVKSICHSSESTLKPETKTKKVIEKESSQNKAHLKIEYEEESANYVTRHLVKSISGDTKRKETNLAPKQRVNSKSNLVQFGESLVANDNQERKRQSSFLASFYDDSSDEESLSKVVTKKPKVSLNQSRPDKQLIKQTNKKKLIKKESSQNKAQFKIEHKEESANYVTRHLVKSISGDNVQTKTPKQRVNSKSNLGGSLTTNDNPQRKRRSSFLASFYDDSSDEESQSKVVTKNLKVSLNQSQPDKQLIKPRGSNVKHGKKWINLPSAITVDEKFDLFLQNSSAPTATPSTLEPLRNANDSDGALDLSHPVSLLVKPKKKSTNVKPTITQKKQLNTVPPPKHQTSSTGNKKKSIPDNRKRQPKKEVVPQKANVVLEESFDSDCAVYVTRRLLKNLPM